MVYFHASQPTGIESKVVNESTALVHKHVDIGDEENQKNHPEVGTIGYAGSLAIAVNSLAGPAILQLPFQYQLSGLIPTTVCLIFVACLSQLTSLHLCNVISKIPNNESFQKCIEFSDSFGIFWGKRAYHLTQILFFLTCICLNMAAMVDTAQVVDSVLGLHFGTVGWSDQGLEVWKHGPCNRKQVKLGLCDPFEDRERNFLLTVGYVITAAVFLPISLMDLRENTNWQIVGFTILVTLSAYFCWVFASVSSHWRDIFLDDISSANIVHQPNVTLWGSQWSDMIGVILFNFTLVLAIPAWLHEKKPDVSVSRVISSSTALSCFMYITVGTLAAIAIPHANVNMLSPMVSGAFGTGMQWASSLFAFFIIGLDIPLFSVLTRYNLTHSGLCSRHTANIIVVWIPWGISWLLYQGDAVGKLLDWGGALLTSAVAFLLPLLLALSVLLRPDTPNGSIAVYGHRWTSHSAQVSVLKLLLYVTIATVVVAIVGQILASEAIENYLNSSAYLNGTNWIWVNETVDWWSNVTYKFK